MALSTDQKQDSHLAGFAEVKQKLGKLEADLETKENHEESTERAIKRDHPLQFQKKGHEEQFKDVQDHMSAVASHLGKLAPSEKDKPIVDKAMKELEEGASTLAKGKNIFALPTSRKTVGLLSWSILATALLTTRLMTRKWRILTSLPELRNGAELQQLLERLRNHMDSPNQATIGTTTTWATVGSTMMTGATKAHKETTAKINFTTQNQNGHHTENLGGPATSVARWDTSVLSA